MTTPGSSSSESIYSLLTLFNLTHPRYRNSELVWTMNTNNTWASWRKRVGVA